MGASRRFPRGMTLIELMISVAILSVILSAVASVVISVTRQRRENSNQVDVSTNARVALSLMKFDAMNAGFRFGAAPFAVRVLQNVTGGEPELADANCAGLAGWTVMPETDVIEFREGADGQAPGKISAPAGTFTINFNGGAYPNPFALPTNGLNTFLIFSSPATACAGRLTTDVQTGTVSMFRQSLRQGAGGTSYPSTGPGMCPSGEMTITALGQVTRYMVCRPPAIQRLARPALFRQTYNGQMAMTDYVRVQDGVEDLQVATLITNALGMVSGASCSGAGPGATCWCGVTPGGDCAGFVPDATATGTLDGTSANAANRTAFLPRAFRIAVTTISLQQRGFSGDQAMLRRPASFDHIQGPVDPATGGNQRTVMEMTVIPQNIVTVSP